MYTFVGISAKAKLLWTDFDTIICWVR